MFAWWSFAIELQWNRVPYLRVTLHLCSQFFLLFDLSLQIAQLVLHLFGLLLEVLRFELPRMREGVLLLQLVGDSLFLHYYRVLLNNNSNWEAQLNHIMTNVGQTSHAFS